MNYNLPKNPGCYLMKDSDDNIIYVGKAKNIKKRVGNYFQKKDHDTKTQQLVENIDSIDFITTDNESEALILENTLIKKHKPKYNINLKDSKRFAFILITDEKFPRILTVRDKKLKGKYFGPFVSGFDRLRVEEMLRKMFKIRTCKKLPRRACLKYHINLCDAPCINNISYEDYNSQINKAELVLKGKTSDLIDNLKQEMIIYSNNQEYEKAMAAKNQISALENLDERQKVDRDKKYDEDIINFIIKEGKVYLMLFKIYKGTLTNKEEFVFDYMDGFYENFISQYYSENEIPKELITPIKINEMVIDFLNYRKNQNVLVTLPQIGEKRKLLNLVYKNIELTYFGNLKKVEALKLSLEFTFSPNVIECFDISHLSGTSTVGSLVQFRNGIPDKTNYRRFKIRSYLGNDDFSGIAEVVLRRYKRLKEENKEFPDLVIIDGGKGQLSAALDSLKKLNINIPIISIAKQFEEIYLPGKPAPITLKEKNNGLLFVREIRDEAHRFAIKYNRLLRKKELIY